MVALSLMQGGEQQNDVFLCSTSLASWYAFELCKIENKVVLCSNQAWGYSTTKNFSGSVVLDLGETLKAVSCWFFYSVKRLTVKLPLVLVLDCSVTPCDVDFAVKLPLVLILRWNSPWCWFCRVKLQEMMMSSTDFTLNLPELDDDNTIFDYTVDSQGTLWYAQHGWVPAPWSWCGYPGSLPHFKVKVPPTSTTALITCMTTF